MVPRRVHPHSGAETKDLLFRRGGGGGGEKGSVLTVEARGEGGVWEWERERGGRLWMDR